jgi:hypothetical protein
MSTGRHSDFHYGIEVALERPDDIPVYCHAGWAGFSDYASERMGEARERRGPAHDRLCCFWGEISQHLISLGMEREAITVLSALNDAEYLAAGLWLDGRWHDCPTSMARILWRLQVSRWVVTSAYELHDRGAKEHLERHKEGSGNRNRGGHFIACLMGTML